MLATCVIPHIYLKLIVRRRRLLKNFYYHSLKFKKRARFEEIENLPKETKRRWLCWLDRYLDLLISFCFNFLFSGCFWTLTSYFCLISASVAVDIFLLFCCNHNSLPSFLSSSFLFLPFFHSLACHILGTECLSSREYSVSFSGVVFWKIQQYFCPISRLLLRCF